MGNQATRDKKQNKKELRRRRSFNPNSSKTRKQQYNDDDDNADASYYDRREASPYAGQSQVGFKQKSMMQSQFQVEQLTGRTQSQLRTQIPTERVGVSGHGGTFSQQRLAKSKYREDNSPMTPNTIRNQYSQSNQNQIRQLDQSRYNIQERGLVKNNASRYDRSADFQRIKDKSQNRNEEEREVYQLGRKGFNTERNNNIYENNNQREVVRQRNEKTVSNYINIYELRGDPKEKDQSYNTISKNQDYQQYGRNPIRYQDTRDKIYDIDRKNGRSATFDQLISGFQKKRESSVEESDNVKQFERDFQEEGNINYQENQEDNSSSNNNIKEFEQSNRAGQNYQKQEIQDLKNTSQFMAQYMLIAGAFSDQEWLTSTTMITFNQKLIQTSSKKEGVITQTFGPEGEPDADLGRYLYYIRDLEKSSIMDVDCIQLVESQKKKKKKKIKSNNYNNSNINRNNQDQDIHNYLQSNTFPPDRELASIIEQQYYEDQRKSQVVRKQTGRFYSGDEQQKNQYTQEGQLYQGNKDYSDDDSQRNKTLRKNKISQERSSPQVQKVNQMISQRRDKSEDKKEYVSDPFPRNILTQGQFSNVSSIVMNGSNIDAQFDGNTPKSVTNQQFEEKGKYIKGYQKKNEGEQQRLDRKKTDQMGNQILQRKGGQNQTIDELDIKRQQRRDSNHSSESSFHGRKQTPRETAEFFQMFQQQEQEHEEQDTQRRRRIKKTNKNENSSLFTDIQKLKEEEEMRDEAKRRAQLQYDQEHKKQEIQDMLLISASQNKNNKNKQPESNFQAYRIQQQEIEELAEQHFQELKKQKFIRERADLYSNSALAQHQRNAVPQKYAEEQKQKIQDGRFKSNSRDKYNQDGRFKSNSRDKDKDVRGKKNIKQIQQQEEQRQKQQQEYEEKWKNFDIKMKERDSKRKSTYEWHQESQNQKNIQTIPTIKEDEDVEELRQRLIERKLKVLEKSKEKQPQIINRASIYNSNFYQNNEKDIVSMIMSNNGFIQPHKEAESDEESDNDDGDGDGDEDIRKEQSQKPIKIDLKQFLKDKEEKRLLQQQQWQTSDKKQKQTQIKDERQVVRQDKQKKQQKKRKGSSSSDSSEADSILNSISHQVDSLKGRIQKDKNAGLLERAASQNNKNSNMKDQIVQNTKQTQGYSPVTKQQKEQQSILSMQDQLFARQSPAPTKKNSMIIIQPAQKNSNKQSQQQQASLEIKSKLEQQFAQGLFVKTVSEYGDDSSVSIQQKINKPQSSGSSAESSKKDILPIQNNNQDISSTSSLSISQQLRERKNEFLKLQIQQQQQQQQQQKQNQPQKTSPQMVEQVSPSQSVTSNQQAQQKQYSAKTEQQPQPQSQSRKQSNQTESGIIVIQSKHSSTQSHRNSQLFSNKPASLSSTANKYPQQEQIQQPKITVNSPQQTNQNDSNNYSQSGSLSGKRLSELGHPSQPRYSFLESGKQSEKDQQVHYTKQNQLDVQEQKQASYNSVSSVGSQLKQQQQQSQKYQQQEQVQAQGLLQQQQTQQQQSTLKSPSLATLGVRQANSSVVSSEESIMKDNLSPKQEAQQYLKGNNPQLKQSFDEISHQSSQDVYNNDNNNVQTTEENKEQYSSSMQSSKSSKSKNQSDHSSLNNSGGIDFFGKPSSNPRSSEEIDFFGKDSNNNTEDQQHNNHGRDQSHSDYSDDGEYKEMSKITEQQQQQQQHVLPHSGFDFGAFGDSNQQHSQNEEEEDVPAKIQININNYKKK